jgi:hypothetical protein
MTPLTPMVFENEIHPWRALSAHKILTASGVPDSVRESCPPGAYLVLKARVVGGGR